MLRSQFSRQILAFGLITGASVWLYPAAQARNEPLIWGLVAIFSLGALLTIFKL